MEQIIAIIVREYVVRVRRRAFLFGTLLTPVVLLAYAVLPTLFINSTGVRRQVIVLDQTGDPPLYEVIKERVEGLESGTRFSLLQVIVPGGDDMERVRLERQEEIRDNSDKSSLILRQNVLDGAQPEYYAKNMSDLSLSEFGHAVCSAIATRRLERAGIASDAVTGYTKPPEMKMIRVSTDGETAGGGASIWLTLLLLFFVFMGVSRNGEAAMRGVIEEKQTRVIEVVVSSVKPFRLMLGKLIGIGLVGLTQYTVWVVSLVILTAFGASFLGRSSFTSQTVPASLILVLSIYFILGYFQLASLYVIVGSIVSNHEDGQQLSRPLRLLSIMPLLTFWIIMRDPNSLASATLSMIPFFAHILMVLRISLISPPLWQILLSIALMLSTILAAVWVAAKIYRVGILMYGKRLSLIEVGRWMRYP